MRLVVDRRRLRSNDGAPSGTGGAPSVRSNLHASTFDGAAFGGMVGFGESYVAAFALALGMGEVFSGLVASLPMFVGGALQLVSLRAVHWIGSEKRWILLGATIQALAFGPLVYAAIAGEIAGWVMFLVVSLYWGAGLATGPAWNAWIETVVPAGIRTKYFAFRSKTAQLTTLSGFLLGGAALALGRRSGHELLAFAAMFTVAGSLRLWSVYWLARHRPIASNGLEKPRPKPTSRKGLERVRAGIAATPRGGRLLLFLVTLQGMVQISGPYFTPYMLKELEFSYLQYVSAFSISFIAKAVSLSLWARLSSRAGARTLLWIGAIGLVPLSALWILSQNFFWVLFIQVISGVFWAAYELGFFLMFFEVLPKDRRVKMLTYYNFANTAAICLGSLTGAWLLHRAGVTMEAYWTLFGLSSTGRLAALGILATAGLGSVPIFELAVRVIGLRVGSASVDTPVLPSLEDADQQMASAQGDASR